MKYLKQFGIIMLITFAGEMLRAVIPLPIPASIYGLVIMLVALMTKVVKLEDVKGAGDFLVEIMPIMFVPAAVGLIDSWGMLKDILMPVLVITFATTIITMAVTGRITQCIIRIEKKRKGNKNEGSTK